MTHKFHEYIVGGIVIGATVGMAAALGGGQYASYSGDNFILDLNKSLGHLCSCAELGKSVLNDLLIGTSAGAAGGGLVGMITCGIIKLAGRK